MASEYKTNAGNNATAYGVYEYPGQPESRYHFDTGRCADWNQYDTSQDAWYFGIWVDVSGRTILTYAEGDVTVVECPTVESFAAELSHMAEFYGDPPPAFVGIDSDGTVTHYFDARPVAA